MKTNQFVDHKAAKLGVEINYEQKICPETKQPYDFWTFKYGQDEYFAFDLGELEDTLDDCLDGGFFRSAEAEADERFVEMAYGPADNA